MRHLTPSRGESSLRRGRLVLVALLGGALALSSCRTRATQTPQFLGDFRHVDPASVDPAFRDDVMALQRAREADPAAADVRVAADKLLARDPPGPLRVFALLAKAEQAYLAGDDPTAVAHADVALAEVDPQSADPVVGALTVVRVRALARGGDPARALLELGRPPLDRKDALPDEERRGLHAVAFDRSGQMPKAMAAYARWRELLRDDDPAAAYAEHRLRRIGATVAPELVRPEIERLEAGAARDCLRARFDADASVGDAPAWVRRCAAASGEHLRVGVLLPRTGPLSALADDQLAALTAAAQVLEPLAAGRAELAFRDAGSTAGSTRDGATALAAEGVHVVVGPIGSANVKVAREVMGDRVELVVPGEGGLAPTLESRLGRLVDKAQAAGLSRVVVLAPDNAYGRRAVEALRAKLDKSGGKLAKIQVYSPATTSFHEVLAPLRKDLEKPVAVVVPDHLSRVELVVRQLMRDGAAPSVDGKKGPLVLTTAEGLGPQTVGPGHPLDGLWLAPVASPTHPDALAFADAYARDQGQPPSDQAVLVFLALRRAVLGGRGELAPTLVRVEGGRLVAAP